jgi:hypothetical protein
VVRTAGGVPLFLEELTRATHEEGAAAGKAEPAVPLTLGEILTARLDRLGEAKRTVQLAAVVGGEFDAETLVAAYGGAALIGEPSGLDLGVLEERGVFRAGERPGAYRFRHVLMQHAAYESLLRRDRRLAHGRVADHLLSVEGHPDARPEILAGHLARAGRSADAVDQWERAARRAGRVGLFKEGGAHLDAAVVLLSELPAGAERDARELRVRTRLGQYLGAIDQAGPAVGEHLRRALELATERGDGPALVEINLTLATHYQATADYAAVHRALDLAEEAACVHGIAGLAPTIGLVRGAVMVWQGRLAEGQATIGEAMEAAGITLDEPPSGDQPPIAGLIVDVVVGGFVLYGLAECLAGRPADAARMGQRASDLAGQHRSAHAQCLAWTTRAITHQLCGDVAAVRSLAAQALSLADDKTTAEFRGWATALAAWADGTVPAVTAADRTGVFMRPYLLSLRADRLTDPTQALVLLDEALAVARATTERFAEAEILRLRAVRQAQLGDLAEAAASSDEAVAVARAQGAAGLEARIGAGRALVAGAGDQLSR